MANVTAPQFQQDVNNAADWANGDENTTVTMRLGQQADSPAKVIKRVDDLAAAQREDIYEKVTPNVKGTFEAGFIFENLFERGKFGAEPNETYWIFTGGTSGLPHVVTAGTDPTLGGPYEQVTFKDHNLLENRNAVGAHDDIYRRESNLSEAISEDATTGTRYTIKDRENAPMTVLPVGAATANGYTSIALPSGRVLALDRVSEINVKWAGAKVDSNFDASNTPTDDTNAVNAVIDYLDGERVNTLYSPGGFCLVTQVVAKSGIVLKGDGQGISYFIQKSGETTPILTDDGTCFNVWIKGLSFDCNGNTIATAGIYLGYQGQQFGVVSGVRDITVRNVTGHGAMFNGNVTTYDTMEFQGVTGRGVILDGEGNKANNVYGSNCDEGVALLKGSSNTLISGHVESSSSIAAFEIGQNTVGNVIRGVKCTGVSANVHENVVLISPNASNYSVSDVRASVSGISNIPNGLIHDISSGVRKIFGENTANVVFSIKSYDGGVRTQLPYKSSTPPTLGTHKVGDWFVSGIGLPGFPIGWVAANSGDSATTGIFTPMTPTAGAIVKTATGTLTRADIGRRFCNDGATSEITLTLPIIQVGDRIHFTRRNTVHKMLLDPNGSQLIRPGGAGKYLSLDTDGASVTLEYMSTNSWCIVAQSGTVSFEP